MAGWISAAAFRTYHGGISSDTDDTLIDDLISAAEKFIENYTGRIFDSADVGDLTKKFDAVADVEGRVLYLGHEELQAITTITNGDTVEVTSGQYVTEPRRNAPYYAIRLLDSANVDWTYTTDPEDAISILGEWGYSQTPPADILQACREITKALYKGRESVSEAGQYIFSGGVLITPEMLPKMTMSTLERYRRKF